VPQSALWIPQLGGHLSLQDRLCQSTRNSPRGTEPIATPGRSGVEDTVNDRRPLGAEVATVYRPARLPSQLRILIRYLGSQSPARIAPTGVRCRCSISSAKSAVPQGSRAFR
jgi:hypothetical protein